jgi:hypothetical protein
MNNVLLGTLLVIFFLLESLPHYSYSVETTDSQSNDNETSTFSFH